MENFLKKYFLESKNTEGKVEILSFHRFPNESLKTPDRAYTPIKKSLLELTSQDALLAQNKLLAKQIEALTETLNKLPQQLHAVQPTHLLVMQIGGCNIYGGVHESGMCMAQNDASKEVNYKTNPNHQGFC